MNIQKFNHNFIIAGSSGYSKVGYYDLTLIDGVQYFHGMKEGIHSRLDLLLQRLTFSEKVNKLVHTPFSNYSFSKLYCTNFKEQKPLVFLFFGQNEIIYQSGYVEFLRKKYPGIKIVLYMIDIISRNKKLDFPKSRELFDLILSYDRGDCERYGLEFFPTSYSRFPVPENPAIESFDVYYCGNAKMRGDLIFDTYKKCKGLGMKCKFFITAAPEKKRIDTEDIVYDKYIDYVENLQYVKKAKCILEVMQTNADGFTPRLWESIIYDRHLLTNNNSIQNSTFYNPLSMHRLEKIDTIKDWIDTPIVTEETTKDALSPVHLLRFIDDKLCSKQ